MKFSGVITIAKSNVHAKRYIIGQRSRSHIWPKSGHFWTITLVWIHGGLWNATQSFQRHSRDTRLCLKVILQISRSHRLKKLPIWPRFDSFQTIFQIWNHWWQWNATQSFARYGRGAILFFKVILVISRSHRLKNCQFGPDLTVSGR